MGVIQRPSRFLKELDKTTYEEATISYGEPDDVNQDIPFDDSQQHPDEE